MSDKLILSVFAAPARPVNIPLDVPVPEGGWTWPPTSATLLAGEREAILVDTVPTVEDAVRLADWIEASGKELTTIYITHSHFDHYLGTSTLLERFPAARVVATAPTVRLIQAEEDSGEARAMYSHIFIDEIGSTVVVPEALADHHLELEGHDVVVVATGQSDVSDSSYIYVPELSAVIVGDIAYNDVHPTLVDSNHETRHGWIETLTKIQELKPEVVVAAHRRPDAVNDGEVLADTITYVREADRLLAEDPTAEEFIERMRRANPDRMNLSTLLYGTALLGLKRP